MLFRSTGVGAGVGEGVGVGVGVGVAVGSGVGLSVGFGVGVAASLETSNVTELLMGLLPLSSREQPLIRKVRDRIRARYFKLRFTLCRPPKLFFRGNCPENLLLK